MVQVPSVSDKNDSESAPADYWKKIVETLDGMLNIFQENFVRDFKFS